MGNARSEGAVTQSDVGTTSIVHVVLASDESGAKGYADATNDSSDEIGVFAEILVPGSALTVVQPAFDQLAARLLPPNGKLHITDLSEDDQAALRKDAFELIREHSLPCFYEAIHVAGFNAPHKVYSGVRDTARRARRSDIRMSANPPRPPSLHVVLFEGLYSKVIAFCIERQKTRLHIEVRTDTDRVDSPIAKEFGAAARKLTDYGATIKHVTGFDAASGTVLKGTVAAGAPSNGAHLPVEIENFELRIVDDSDGLVVAADVLANSLHHLFSSRPNEERYRALNTPSAFARHPLHDCLDSFERWDDYNFTDTYYRHPLDPALKEETDER